MTETESGESKPTEEDRDPADMKGDAAAKGSKSTPGDPGGASAADEDCPIDLDSARDRAS